LIVEFIVVSLSRRRLTV